MIKLKDLLNEKLYNSQGEGYTFGKGDIVKDINPECPHQGAEGEVIKGGKLKITFRVTNNGENYKEGDELEKTVDQMVKLNSDEITEEKLTESANPVKVKKSVDIIIKELRKRARKLNDDEFYEVTVELKKWFNKNVHEGIKEEKIDEQGYSSPEAKKIVDGALRQYSKQLRKLQYQVIKDWMSKAKNGMIDFFDINKGLQAGDVSRAHPYETQFLHSVLTRDKIIDRFRKYFGGKKGKKR